ncbi:MAG: ATP-binding cassette domain-containing protein [Anaerolineaceae bacterium]|nr:ATP-binding cassette domain-containing protein [Anaerolineaceae bacterium]
MKPLLVYLKPYWRLALIAPLLMVLEVVMDLLQPRMMQRIVDQGIRLGDQHLVLETGLVMVVFALIGAVGGIGCTVFAVRAAYNFGTDLRGAVYRKIQSLSFANLDQLGTGQLVTRLTNDVTQIQEVVLLALRILVRVPLIMIGSLIMAFLTSSQLALMALPLIPPLAIMLWFVVRQAHPLYLKVQNTLDRVNTVIQENLGGVRVVKAFVREEHEEGRFGEANIDMTVRSIKAMQITAIASPVLLLLMNVGIAGVLWIGGNAVKQGTLTVGEIIAVITYLTQMLSSVLMVSMLLIRLSRAQASTERINEILNSLPTIQDRPDALQEFHPHGCVAFENVTFGYGEPVLKDISFVAEPGQTVAILGTTGSGKSSLIHLIPRFYDVTSGRVTIDGIDVRDIAQSVLRSQIGIALQEAVLFSGTISENIRQGNLSANDNVVRDAARMAQANDFIVALPEGYETRLGQRGVNLSGGQKQRLSIARALIRKPPILILDDSTSAVDVETESQIQEALAALMKGCTSFIVAQRISTVLNADKILVIDEGHLVAEGTHRTLIQSSPIYRQIYESQLGEPDHVTDAS